MFIYNPKVCSLEQYDLSLLGIEGCTTFALSCEDLSPNLEENRIFSIDGSTLYVNTIGSDVKVGDCINIKIICNGEFEQEDGECPTEGTLIKLNFVSQCTQLEWDISTQECDDCLGVIDIPIEEPIIDVSIDKIDLNVSIKK